MDTSLQEPAFWGVVSSILLSIAKKIGLKDAHAPVFNILVAGLGNFAYLVMTGTAWKQAAASAVGSVISSHVTFKAIGKPIAEARSGSA